MKCWWEKHHPEKWIFIRPFLLWWEQYRSPQGDGSVFPYGLTGVGWFPLAGPLHPRWWNVSKFGNLHSPDGITLPKCVCNWEGGGGLALSCRLCVDLCIHFQVVFKLLQRGQVNRGSCCIYICRELPETPRPEPCDRWLLHRIKKETEVFKGEKDGSQIFSSGSTFCVSVIFSWCLEVHVSLWAWHTGVHVHTHTHTEFYLLSS